MKCWFLWFIMIIAHWGLYAQVPLVFIEGNIGSGKSTLAKIIERRIGVVVSLEPCDEWQNVQGVNLLHEFYKNPAQYGCLFQIYVSMTRIQKQERDALGAKDVQFMERSWFSDRYCFAQILKNSGNIDEISWIIYDQMWHWYKRNACMPIFFVYLQVPVDICYQRLQTRARSEEAGVPLSYLEKLHEAHEHLFIHKNISDIIDYMPILVLDGSINFKDDVGIQEIFMNQILDFLKIHGNIDLQYVDL